jgi:Ser/Thr protein kinase RdoA (MazF antagonist)
MLSKQLRYLIEEESLKKFKTKTMLEFIKDFSTRMSFVFQYRITHGEQTDIIFIKSDKTQCGMLQREYENLSLFKQVECTEHFKLPQVFLYSDDALVLFECQGQLVRKLMVNHCKQTLRKVDGKVLGAVRQVGQWLNYYFHQTKQWQSWQDIGVALKKECDEYEKNLQGQSSHSVIGQFFLDLKSELENALNSARGDALISLAHGDCHLGNFYVQGETITALDFQHSRLRLAGYDALYFDALLSLCFGKTKYRPFNIKAIRSAFWQGVDLDINDNLLHFRLTKVMIGLRILTYLNSLNSSYGLTLKWLTRLELRKLMNWLEN